MTEERATVPETSAVEPISAATMLEMMKEQQRIMLQQQETQQRMMQLLEQQKAEFASYRVEMSAALSREGPRGEPIEPKLPKPTLQKLDPKDDIEHFLATFERIAQQQKWPATVWATQLAGLLTGKAMAAFASMKPEEAGSYAEVKRAILQRYEVNEDTHRLRFRKDRCGAEETYREWSHRLQEHFVRWRKDQDIPLEELVLIEQFMAEVPQDLAVWLRERKPKSLREAAEQADDYVAARKDEGRSEGNQSELQRMSKGGQLSDPRPSADTGGRMQPPPATIAPEHSKTNSKGEKQCFWCHGWGHVSYNCPKVQEAQVPTQRWVSRTE